MSTPTIETKKPGVPRAALLGGALLFLAGLAYAGFSLSGKPATDTTVADAPPLPPVSRKAPVRAKAGKPAAVAKRIVATPADSALAAAKAQALQAGGTPGGRILYDTSFDNVPKSLGGSDARVFPVTPSPATDNGGKVRPIVLGRLPNGLRGDPFVSRLIVPLPREFAYTLAVPIRLARQPRPIVVRGPDIPADIALGPLPYIPRRVAGFLEFGGVSAILETGNFGSGEINIVQPGSRVASGDAAIGPLTVESISSTEVVLRSDDKRRTRVALSGVPGGIAVPSRGSQGAPRGGPPPGFNGGGGNGGGGAMGAD